MSHSSEERVGVLISGGLDSSILVADLAKRGRIVQPFYIRTGLTWETEELESVQRFLSEVARPEIHSLVSLSLPLRDLYGDHWSVTGRATPDSASPDEAVFLPGRNALLLVKAAVWCQLNGIGELAMAPLGTSPFPDAHQRFFEDFAAAINSGATQRLKITRPFGHMTKKDVMRLGIGLPLETTFSCISPVRRLHCGACNKCSERMNAFRIAEMTDPTHYAFENR